MVQTFHTHTRKTLFRGQDCCIFIDSALERRHGSDSKSSMSSRNPRTVSMRELMSVRCGQTSVVSLVADCIRQRKATFTDLETQNVSRIFHS